MSPVLANRLLSSLSNKLKQAEAEVVPSSSLVQVEVEVEVGAEVEVGVEVEVWVDGS